MEAGSGDMMAIEERFEMSSRFRVDFRWLLHVAIWITALARRLLEKMFAALSEWQL
jgi:hypothetical protein